MKYSSISSLLHQQNSKIPFFFRATDDVRTDRGPAEGEEASASVSPRSDHDGDESQPTSDATQSTPWATSDETTVVATGTSIIEKEITKRHRNDHWMRKLLWDFHDPLILSNEKTNHENLFLHCIFSNVYFCFFVPWLQLRVDSSPQLLSSSCAYLDLIFQMMDHIQKSRSEIDWIIWLH